MSVPAAPAAPARRPALAAAAPVAWTVLACTAAGSVAGFLVGGIGGRLAMLLLRVASPEARGVVSDDGFEIGVVSLDTVQLVAATTLLGGLNGVLYAALRPTIPRRARLPLWSLFAAAVGGSQVVHEDGVDFVVLRPVLLAVVLFTLLPGAAAALVVLLAERWAARPPWRSRSLAGWLVVAAAGSTFAVGAALAVAAAGVALARAGRIRHRLGRLGAHVVPLALSVGCLAAAVDLVRESARILAV